MEEESTEESIRWTSYPSHEHDLRMQNHVQNYDPYDIDSRPPRSAYYADTSSSRGPVNMKTLLANQQAAGWRKSKPSAVAHHIIRKEGPNWILIIGSALVTALGVMIVRRRKPSIPEEKTLQKAVLTLEKDRVQPSGLSFATTRRESTGSRTSEVSTDSPYSGDAYMLTHAQPQFLSEGSRVGSDSGDEECMTLSPSAFYSHFTKGSNHSIRTVITPTSPPGSYRGADTSATECNDSIALSPPARLTFSTRRDIVYRLRQQLKSRDEMILDMQAQISDQERTISLQQAHCRDLESRLEDVSKTLCDSEHEIQRLRNAVAEYLDGNAPNSGNWGLSQVSSVSLATPDSDKGGYYQQTCQQDENHLVRETRRLADEVRVREDEKRELERLASLRIKEHELVVQRLQELEAELEEARKSGFGKDLLLEAYEVEHENLEDKVVSLKRILETKPPERSPASSMIGRRSLPGGLGSLILERKGSKEKNSSNSDGLRLQGRDFGHSYTPFFERTSEQSPTYKRTSKGWFKTDESSSNGDASDDSETEDTNLVLNEKLLKKLQQEVERLSVILANHSHLITEKRLEANRLVDEFQRHSALISDFQKRLDEHVEAKPDWEQDWETVSQFLSFSSDATSAAQVQELSHKLEEIAKQQRVEEEIGELSKHQVKIAELKQRVEKILKRCQNSQNCDGNLDAAIHQQANKLTAAGFELARQLALQEAQARRTSREVQRLSASFQLSSPYVPRSKKEELRKMLQDGSSESVSPPFENGPQDPIHMSHMVSVTQSRFPTGSEGKPKESCDVLFDRAISVSSAETETIQSDGSLAFQMQDQFVYNPGFSRSPSCKFRKGFPINSGSRKEQSPRAKRRIARGTKKGVASEVGKELVRSDSNRWNDKSRVLPRYSDGNIPQYHGFQDMRDHQKKLFPKWQSRGEVTGDSDWAVGSSPVYSRNMQEDDISLVRSQSPIRRRSSGGSFSDSSTMKPRSSTFAGHNVSLETSIESNKGSFGRFLFNIERGNQVLPVNFEGRRDGMSGADTALLSPFSKIMVGLDFKESSPPSASQEFHSLGSSISGLSSEITREIEGKYLEDRSDTSTGSVSSISIDSSFNTMLDNTLDDLVRVFSTPSVPAAICVPA